MLDFHTILFPKNSRTSKISRRKKGLSIRIYEREESNSFFVVGTPFTRCTRSKHQELCPSAPHAQQHWRFIEEHPQWATPRASASWCDVCLPPQCTGSPPGVTQHWPFHERERKKNSDKKNNLPGLPEPSQRSHVVKPWPQELDDFDFTLLLGFLSQYFLSVLLSSQVRLRVSWPCGSCALSSTFS